MKKIKEIFKVAKLDKVFVALFIMTAAAAGLCVALTVTRMY